MTRYDLLVRNGILVTEASVGLGDIAIADGRIVAIGPELEGDGQETIDARGLHI